ncbi:hypothetical protein PMAYCL1PPCAC_24298, partial [Pristionchus mayeri]
DEEFENDGASMARSKIKSRALQWKKGEVSPAKEVASREKIVMKMQKTPEKKTVEEMKSSDSPEPPPRSLMQSVQGEKKKETPTERSSMLPPSPISPSNQSSVRKEVKEENKVEKSEVSRKFETRDTVPLIDDCSRHSKKEDNSRENTEKSFMRNLRPRLSLFRKSKSRSDKTGVREMAKKEDRCPSDSTSSQMSQTSPDKSSRENTSTRLDVAASAVDKSMKSIKSMFKKTDDTKKRMEDLLPH